MSVFKPRNRLVYFRISEEEFEQFNNLCRSEGARSLSDMARIVVRHSINQGSVAASHSINRRLEQLSEELVDLRRQFEQLNRLLKGRSNGNSATTHQNGPGVSREEL